MQTEIDSLRQRITELEAEKAELKAELEAKNTEIPELKKKLAEVEARNVEIEARNADLMKQMIEENNRRDARIEDTNDRVAKLEQKQLQNDDTPNNNLSNFNSGAEHHEEPLEDKGMDNFLNEVDKKRIGEDIRRRNKEKKLQRESAVQDVTPEQSCEIETVDDDNSSGNRIINENNSSTFSELSHEIEVIAHSVVNPKLSHERETITNTSPTLSPEIDIKMKTERPDKEDSSDRLPGPKETPSTMNGQISSSIATEFVQDLLEELLSPSSQLFEDIKFSPPKTIVPESIDIKRLANLFSQAVSARKKSITAKRAEISSWGCFSERFENKAVELRTNDKKLTDQTARKQIYNEMKPYLTDTSDEYLRVRTCKARKIN
jgi:hypothetical protein